MKLYTVLIAGAGQLGSRYLQGLSKSQLGLKIFVYDISTESLARAEERWSQVSPHQFFHSVSFLSQLEKLPKEIDLAIVATTANVRTMVLSAICKTMVVRYWILEKVLAQNEVEVDKLGSLLQGSEKAWVNTPYRAMKLYHDVKKEMHLDEPFACEIKAGKTFGIACNSIHYLDLLQWLSGKTIISIDPSGLDSEWVTTKRAGFWDIFGTLSISFSDGSIAIIKGETWEPSIVTINIDTTSESWRICENDGTAVRGGGLIIRGKIEYQSEMTAPIVESILSTGGCNLPEFGESAILHKLLIGAFLSHWNKYMPGKVEMIPIT